MKKDYNCTRFPHRVKRALMQLSDDAKGHEMAYCFMRACFEYDDSGVKTDFADFGMNLIFADFVEFAENGKRLAQERSEIYRNNAKKRWKESRLSQEPEAERLFAAPLHSPRARHAQCGASQGSLLPCHYVGKAKGLCATCRI